MNLKRLHEEYIDIARRPMQLGRTPIVPKDATLPIIPVERWVKVGDPKRLTKTFIFRRKRDKKIFISDLLDYEIEVGHSANLTIDENKVLVKLITPGVESITELDKEYAKFVDTLYRDIVTRID